MPDIPAYLITFESAVRPLVTAIALALIWIGAARMEAPAVSRYLTAGALSVSLIAWLAVAQYFGAASACCAGAEASGRSVSRSSGERGELFAT